MKKLSIEDLNSDKRDFAFKDLTNSQLDPFCHAVTQWELATSYQFAQEFWGRILPMKKRKNLQLKSSNIKFPF